MTTVLGGGISPEEVQEERTWSLQGLINSECLSIRLEVDREGNFSRVLTIEVARGLLARAFRLEDC